MNAFFLSISTSGSDDQLCMLDLLCSVLCLSLLIEFSPSRTVYACSIGLQGCNHGMQQQRAHLPDALYKQEAILLLSNESAP